MRTVSVHGDYEVVRFDISELKNHAEKYGVRNAATGRVLEFPSEREATRWARRSRKQTEGAGT